ncbi:unnamed protein product, partial [Ectocarpus sp. 12 AP-2014]
PLPEPSLPLFWHKRATTSWNETLLLGSHGFLSTSRNYFFLRRFESALVTTGTYYRTIPTRDLKTTSTRFNDSMGSSSLVKSFRKKLLGHLTQCGYSLCVESRHLICLRKKGSSCNSCNRGSIF